MSTPPAKPLVVMCPAPQRTDRIFTPPPWSCSRDRFTVVDLEKESSGEALEE